MTAPLDTNNAICARRADSDGHNHRLEKRTNPVLTDRDYYCVLTTLVCLLHRDILDELEPLTCVSDVARVIANHVPNGSIGCPNA